MASPICSWVFAPLEGWRHVKVTDRHTAIDYAHVLRDLSDTHFPDAAKIVLVQDNLNIHKPASICQMRTFPAPEARRLVERFEWHYTPKHTAAGSTCSQNRTRRSRVAMSGSPHRRQANTHPRSYRMAGPPQQAPRQSRLAIHNRQRPRQAEETVCPQFSELARLGEWKCNRTSNPQIAEVMVKAVIGIMQQDIETIDIETLQRLQRMGEAEIAGLSIWEQQRRAREEWQRDFRNYKQSELAF